MAKRKKNRKSGATAPAASANPSAGPSAQPSTKSGGDRTPVLKRRSLPNWPLLLPALAGMALTAYLTATVWMEAAPAYCAEGSDCEIVQGSRWGTLFGLPTAAWGFLAYAALGHVAFRVRDPKRHWLWAWGIALGGLSISVYLTAISVYVLEATCFYCLGSLGLMAAIFAIVLWQKPAGLEGFSWPVWAGQTGALAVAAVVALHLHYSGVFNPAAGPEDPYLSSLAQHLSASGAIFYGAYW